GDNMEHLDLSVFAERNRLIALIDHDPGSDPVRKRFITKCEHLGIPIHRLKRYSIESYFSLRALREFYKGQIPKDIQELPHDRPAEDVLKVGLKRNSRRIGELMRLDELAGTDLLQFIEKVEKLSTTTL
ncbi:hypothetical protein, partial [Longimicrobium sp.]|uniref:hypothetical protein n=1 Tax=Longimicrobium sp. TaxID=2029185 RepID=UPI002E3356FD